MTKHDILARGKRRNVLHDEPTPLPPGAPKDAARIEFGRRVQRKMVEKGWNQSELAREATKFMPDGKEIIRDTISKYINGVTLPSPQRLDALAHAFGVEPKDLLPTRGITARQDSTPPLDVRKLEDGSAWLRINQNVPWSIAVKILTLLEGDGE